MNIFGVKTELRRPIERRMKKIFKRAVLTEFIIYLLVSTTGYLSFMEKTP